MIVSVNLRLGDVGVAPGGKVASSSILAFGEAILEAVGLTNEFWKALNSVTGHCSAGRSQGVRLASSSGCGQVIEMRGVLSP